MLGPKLDPSGRDQALETLCMFLLVLCLLAVLIYGSLSSTTVVVAAPPGQEASNPAPDRAPAP